MRTSNEIGRDRGQVDPRVVIGIVIAAVVILAAIWLLTREPEPEPIPEPSRPGTTVEPAQSPEERGDNARAFIDELSAGGEGIDYAQAYERARAFREDGQLADAQLLYFFAARGGHGEAAFDLAASYDPNHPGQASSLMNEPDPFQAWRWYRQAEESGHGAAGERLAALRDWAVQAAQSGDAEAERLLLQWE